MRGFFSWDETFKCLAMKAFCKVNLQTQVERFRSQSFFSLKGATERRGHLEVSFFGIGASLWEYLSNIPSLDRFCRVNRTIKAKLGLDVEFLKKRHHSKANHSAKV